MHRLRGECPWDARQTHRSLIKHLVEESAEVIDAVETGRDADLAEELGDLLLQVVFHAEIAEEEGRFSFDDVARGITDKLIRRHTWVFGDDQDPGDTLSAWEKNKQDEKHRSSVLDGIAGSMPTLARAQKVASRLALAQGESDVLEPITAEEAGRQVLSLVGRAQASGVDIDQATRDALRRVEARVRRGEEGDQPTGPEIS